MKNERFRKLSPVSKDIHKEFARKLFNAKKYGTNPTLKLGEFMIKLRDNEVLDEYVLIINDNEERIHVSGTESISKQQFSFTFSTRR